MNVPQGTTPESLGYFIRSRAYPGLGSDSQSHSDAATRVARASIAYWRENLPWISGGYGGSQDKLKRDIRYGIARQAGVPGFAFVVPAWLLPIALQVLVALIEQAMLLLASWASENDVEGRLWMRAASTED